MTDKAIPSADDAQNILRQISRAAVELGHTSVVRELGVAEILATQAIDPLENIPEVTPVQKLAKTKEIQERNEAEAATDPEALIPFNLNALRKRLREATDARRLLSNDATARQRLLEESVYDVAVERFKHEMEVIRSLELPIDGAMQSVKKWMWDWHVKLELRLVQELERIKNEEEEMVDRKKHQALTPFLSLLTPKKLSLIVILEVMRLQGSGGIQQGMKTARALLTIGKAVELEYKAEMCKINGIDIPEHITIRTNGAFFTALGYRHLHERRVAARKQMEDAEDWTAEWTQSVRARLGSILVDALMDVATVTRTATDPRTGEDIFEEQPAFFHTYEYVRGHKLGVLKVNPVVSDRFARDPVRDTLHPRHLPMLVAPKPWLSHDQGGYYFSKSHAMRYKDSREQQVYMREASQAGNVELVYAGLDVLGNTPWNINRDVFNVVLDVWNSGKKLGKIPAAVLEIEEPVKPANYDADLTAKSNYLERMKAVQVAKGNNHSDRCSVNYKIEIARAFLGDTFYFPHNVDFRGRAYPMPPHLNHIGDDLSRGLLKFGESKPLGESGLRWLKIHLANLYGYDKANFQERVDWVMERLDDVYDSAENPLTGRGWWQNADEPWQCLATCMELRNALMSPDPHAFESSLPVHQDGTCNGLQHYAALGGDMAGAQQVNLMETDRPADVYTYVADLVEKLTAEDAANGNKYALLCQGKISRKVVKQTVMTTVYGVTFIGAREQIQKQLKDRADLPAEECWPLANYIAQKTMHCIGDLFKGAKDIMTWLNLAARIVSKSTPRDRLEAISAPSAVDKPVYAETFTKRLSKELMTSVIWTTPLGLPIVQPYRKTKRKQIMTAVQTVYISDPNTPSEVNSVKQASAFPPNFIHSLDATHMMLTALECKSNNITFASVHDSYWTHASSIDQMSTIIRDTFIALHSSDILGRLRDEIRERYADYWVPIQVMNLPRMKMLLTSMGGEVPASNATIGRPSKRAASARKRTSKKAKAAESESPLALSEGDEAAMEGEEKLALLPDESAPPLPSGHFPWQKSFVKLIDTLPPIPQKGDFKIDNIRQSKYFFS
ncbi:DNA/RNA polymerase [Sistotremastrum suecicum HHB10207 ss-3]|nr:DNA/RNA polymerase [Sistotremastrum suecicum HHB10207 ss-3]